MPFVYKKRRRSPLLATVIHPPKDNAASESVGKGPSDCISPPGQTVTQPIHAYVTGH